MGSRNRGGRGRKGRRGWRGDAGQEQGAITEFRKDCLPVGFSIRETQGLSSVHSTNAYRVPTVDQAHTRAWGHGRGQNQARSLPLWRLHSDGETPNKKQPNVRGHSYLGWVVISVKKCDKGSVVAGSHQKGVSFRPHGGRDLKQWKSWFWEEPWLADPCGMPANTIFPVPETHPLCPPHPCPLFLSSGLTSTGRCPRTLRSQRTLGPLVSSHAPCHSPYPNLCLQPLCSTVKHGGQERQEEE